MAEPQVNPEDLDRQIDEMLGRPETVAGSEPKATETPAASEPPHGEAPPSTTTPAVVPAEEDRLGAALKTIENLQREVVEMRAEVSARSRPMDAARPEPSIEFEEVLGRRVPKDRSKRAIKVQAEDLLRLGWNEDPAKVIELLGNAMFDFLVDVIPSHTTQSWQNRTQAEERARANLNSFWSAHEDLKDLQPFVKTVEDMSLADGTLNPAAFPSQGDYNVALGRKVREKVAAMRGLSYDQYLAAVSRGSASPASPPSRAVATGGGSPSRGARPPAGSQQSEIDDLINNR